MLDWRIKAVDGLVATVDLIGENFCQKAHAANETTAPKRFQK